MKSIINIGPQNGDNSVVVSKWLLIPITPLNSVMGIFIITKT